MTEQPGWESPSRPPGEPAEPTRPPLTADWAADQPAPLGWSDPGYAQQPGQQAPGNQQPAGWGGAPAQQGGGQPGWGPQPTWLPPKPGVIPLRPLGVGEILDGAISTIRAKPRLMIGLSAVLAVVTQLVTVPVSWLLLHDSGDKAFSLDQAKTGAGPEGNIALTASSLTASAIQVVVTLVATLLLTGILTIVLSRAVLGQDIDGKQAWELTRPRLPALTGVLLAVFLVEVVGAVVLIGPGVALAVAGSSDIAIALALVVGILLYVCVSIYVYVVFALAPAVTVLEKQPVVASLKRSRRLVQGAWWRTFGIVVLVNIIAGIVNSIFSGIFSLGALLAAGVGSGFDNLNPYELVPLLISAVGAILGAAITWPFTAVGMALIYVDRRIRREGLDLELARAAGYTPPGTSATPGAPLDSSAGGVVPSSASQPPPPYGG